ncbi:MAG TPA: glutathione S-transferase [Ramlibacter sp.]|uniref:glutathione S-transferase family protein n=1 Tax=Ramlibacter sp. TaxID=1917967 RepID=UPI002BBBC549|nr:glutathione S-transferase [Ramlibacter sp.]HVZ44002.1 glutathione S-transferase [Ramlibacter sp.]
MKLHWSPKSPYVRKVMVVAHETGLVERLERVRSVAAMLEPNDRLMRDNPLSKIPTLVLDDGTTLFDSVVICEYLNDLAGASLFPEAGAAKWRALRWHAFGDGLLDALILWRNERDRPDASRSERLMNAFERKTIASLHWLDEEAQALQSAPFGIGHVALGCALGYLDFRFDSLGWRTHAPRLAGWGEAVHARPSFASTVPTLAG